MKAAVEARGSEPEDPRRHRADVLRRRRSACAGYRLNVSDLVEARAQQAQVLGVDGIVCSPEEAAHLHKIVGHQMHLVTPGIRPRAPRPATRSAS
jgi:orotidine-5'-phosphate decarboxylase